VSVHRDEMLELCAAYALGTIEEKDRKRLEAHLSEGCPECEHALREFGHGATLLAASAPRILPMPELRDRALGSVESEEQAEGAIPVGAERRRAGVDPFAGREPGKVVPMPRTGRPAWFAWAGWVAAAVLLVTSATFYESGGRLREIITDRESALDGLSRDLAVERQWLGVLTTPMARIADFEPAPGSPAPGPAPPEAAASMLGSRAIRGRAVYDPATRRAVLVFSNLSAPDSVSYQLWALRGAKPTSLAVLRPDEHGAAVLRLENVGEPTTLTAFAITREPKGGSPNKNAPSGPIVLTGILREASRAPSRG